MADNKKYYYLKLKENFFETDDLKILQNMPDGYLYSDILLKLYLRSLKDKGRLMYKNIIPYTPQVIANVVNHPVGIVEKALDIFQKMKLIEVLDNGTIYMLDIQNFIGNSSTEADRKREQYRRIQEEKELIKENLPTYSGEIVEKSPRNRGEISEKSSPEIREQRLENKKEKDKKENDKINYQLIADMYNDTCVSFPRVTKLSDNRKKAIRARMKQYSIEEFQRLFEMTEQSDFLKGKNTRNWSANFDWLLKDANMAKVLDGNYANSGSCTGATIAPNPNNRFHNFDQRTYDNMDEIEQQLFENQGWMQENENAQ